MPSKGDMDSDNGSNQSMGYISGFPKAITDKIVGKDPRSAPNGNQYNNMSPGINPNQGQQFGQPPQMMMPGMGGVGPFGGPSSGGMQGPPTLPGLDM